MLTTAKPQRNKHNVQRNLRRGWQYREKGEKADLERGLRGVGDCEEGLQVRERLAGVAHRLVRLRERAARLALTNLQPSPPLRTGGFRDWRASYKR